MRERDQFEEKLERWCLREMVLVSSMLTATISQRLVAPPSGLPPTENILRQTNSQSKAPNMPKNLKPINQPLT